MKNFRFRLRTKIRNRIKLNQRAINFNKEIFVGEIGALLFAPIFTLLASHIFRSPNLISFSALAGSLSGGCILWLATRIYDEKKYGNFSAGKFSRDIAFYTPVAFLISILISYPTVVIVTRFLFIKDHAPIFSSLAGELSGFLIFLILINTYRIILNRSFKKKL